MQAKGLRFARTAVATWLLAASLVLIGASSAAAHDLPPAGPECDAASGGAWPSRVLLFGETAGARNDAAITAGR